MPKRSTTDFKDDEYYEVKLMRPVEYPPGSGKKIPVATRVTMRGRAAKMIEKDIADAKPKSG